MKSSRCFSSRRFRLGVPILQCVYWHLKAAERMSLWSPNSITRNLFLFIIHLHPCTRELFCQIVVTVPSLHLFPSKECSRCRLLRCLVSDHQFFYKCLRVCFGQDSATGRVMPLMRWLLAFSQPSENNSLCLMCTPDCCPSQVTYDLLHDQLNLSPFASLVALYLLHLWSNVDFRYLVYFK